MIYFRCCTWIINESNIMVYEDCIKHCIGANFNPIEVITLIRSCYGKFNSFRVKLVGAQKLFELFQFLHNPVRVLMIHPKTELA